MNCAQCGQAIPDGTWFCNACSYHQHPPQQQRKKSSFWLLLLLVPLGMCGIGTFFFGLFGSLVSSSRKADLTSASPLPTLLAAPTPTLTKWQLSESKSEMDDSPTVTLSLTAENDISGWLTSSRPTLYVRCREGSIDTVIRTGMSADPELGRYQSFTVRLRLDDEQPITQYWDEGTNREVLFAPNGLQLARQLAAAKTLLFEFTPFNSPLAHARFDVSGLADLLPKVEEACKKKGGRK